MGKSKMDPRDCVDCSNSDFVAIREPGRVLVSPELSVRRGPSRSGNRKGIWFAPRGWFEIEVSARAGVTVPRLAPIKCEDQFCVFVEAFEFAWSVYEIEAAGGPGAWQPCADVVERLGPLATYSLDLEDLDEFEG